MKFILKLLKPKNLLTIISNPKLIIVHLTYAFKRLFYDIVFFFIRNKYKHKIIFIAGMPMSATTKIKNMCGMINGYFTRYTPMPEKIMYSQNITESAFRYCPSWSYSLFKTHLNPFEENINIIKKNNVKKVVVSYRDLRDVVVARYHRLLKFPKKIGEPGYLEEDKQYKNIKKTDAINDCIEVVSRDFVKWINGWFNISSKEKNFVLFCKFEDLILNPKNEFQRILNFYEIKLSDDKIDYIVEFTRGKKNMEKNFNEAKVLPWALSSNFRSGKIGGWKTEFDQSNIKKFKSLAGDSLIQLKYETDTNW